jgi:hypothetical protein
MPRPSAWFRVTDEGPPRATPAWADSRRGRRARALRSISCEGGRTSRSLGADGASRSTSTVGGPRTARARSRDILSALGLALICADATTLSFPPFVTSIAATAAVNHAARHRSPAGGLRLRHARSAVPRSPFPRPSARRLAESRIRCPIHRGVARSGLARIGAGDRCGRVGGLAMPVRPRPPASGEPYCWRLAHPGVSDAPRPRPAPARSAGCRRPRRGSRG